MTLSVPDLGTSKTEIAVDEHGCWIWQMNRDRHGYGAITKWHDGNPRTYRAHRYVYELLVGPIPEGLVIDHLCRVRACVNPEHMEPVTLAENLRRGRGGVLSVLRPPKPWPTHCVHGHELTPRNTYVLQGRPKCRRCSSDRTIRWQHRERGDGRGHVGERSPAAKLSDADVQYIRSSNLSTIWLAELYGVRPTTISNVRRRKTWKHLL